MEEMYCMGGEYSSSAAAEHVHDANMQAAGQLPDAPAGMPADAHGAVTEAMGHRESNARMVNLS